MVYDAGLAVLRIYTTRDLSWPGSTMEEMMIRVYTGARDVRADGYVADAPAVVFPTLVPSESVYLYPVSDVMPYAAIKSYRLTTRQEFESAGFSVGVDEDGWYLELPFEPVDESGLTVVVDPSNPSNFSPVYVRMEGYNLTKVWIGATYNGVPLEIGQRNITTHEEGRFVRTDLYPAELPVQCPPFWTAFINTREVDLCPPDSPIPDFGMWVLKSGVGLPEPTMTAYLVNPLADDPQAVAVGTAADPQMTRRVVGATPDRALLVQHGPLTEPPTEPPIELTVSTFSLSGTGTEVYGQTHEVLSDPDQFNMQRVGMVGDKLAVLNAQYQLTFADLQSGALTDVTGTTFAAVGFHAEEGYAVGVERYGGSIVVVYPSGQYTEIAGPFNTNGGEVYGYVHVDDATGIVTVLRYTEVSVGEYVRTDLTTFALDGTIPLGTKEVLPPVQPYAGFVAGTDNRFTVMGDPNPLGGNGYYGGFIAVDSLTGEAMEGLGEYYVSQPSTSLQQLADLIHSRVAATIYIDITGSFAYLGEGVVVVVLTEKQNDLTGSRLYIPVLVDINPGSTAPMSYLAPEMVHYDVDRDDDTVRVFGSPRGAAYLTVPYKVVLRDGTMFDVPDLGLPLVDQSSGDRVLFSDTVGSSFCSFYRGYTPR